MKKLSALLALLLSMALLAGCHTDAPEKPETNDTPDTPEQEQTETVVDPEPDTEPEAVETPVFDEKTLPLLDGSTATIPLSEGIVQALLGYDAAEAQAFVKHNTTHNAYVNLIDGKCDLIFVTPPSADEYAMMDDSGRKFEVERIVKDAFVFMVNKDNPVEDISLEDLQKIYKGEITNWKELGGSDEPIKAFQRPDNSGSQTLMYKLVVPADEIAPAPTEMRPGGMDDLVDAVSDYDEGLHSIGYSVYYYASGMYTDPGSKMIAVDGVYPTDETIADGSYPLTDGYYAVYDAEHGENSPVGRLLAWLRSENGQKVAQASGYVPLMPLN
ncbi:MAG: substrate-binding domain-containing protein [Clostridia bacterium]|nr:substrate-binding domain-containing protein [Clostridia bacterium]